MATQLTPGERVAWDKPCIIAILDQVSPLNLRKCFTVCKRWRDTILEQPRLYGSCILGCIEHSKFHLRIPQANLRDEALGHVAIVQLLRRDFTNARLTLEAIDKFDSKVYVLTEAAQQIEAQMRESTKQKVGEVVLPILAEAKSLLKENKGQYRYQKIPKIVKMEAAYDPDTARETCDLLPISHVKEVFRGTQDCFERDIALFAILQVYVSQNPPDIPRAEAILSVIEMPKYKIKGLCEIARYQQEAIARAKALLPQVSDYPQLEAASLFAILKAEALYNPYEAEKTASQIDDRVVGAYVEIARGSFNKNPQKTKEWAAEIKSIDCQIRVQFEIAMMEKDYESALNFAEKILWEKDRAKACIEMAKKDLRFLTRALIRTREISDVREKVSLLIEVAKLDPHHNFNEAKQTALKSRDRNRDDLFTEIAQAEAVTDPGSALMTTRQIVNTSSPTQQVHALLKIAEKVAENDNVQTRVAIRKAALSQIRAAVRLIPFIDLHLKVEITCKVAQALLRNYHPVDPNFGSSLN